MLRADILNALGGQLDELQSVTKWALGFGFTATILAVQGDDPITVVNLSLSRIEAFFVIAALYIAACTAALGHFRKLRLLVTLLSPEDIAEGFSKLSAHKWLLNPFVLHASPPGGRSHGQYAMAVLVCVFWLCLGSLYALLPRSVMRTPLGVFVDHGLFSVTGWIEFGTILGYFVPVGLFVTVGWFALLVVQETVADAVNRVPAGNQEFKARLEFNAQTLKIGADWGIAAGGVLMVIIMLIVFGPG